MNKTALLVIDFENEIVHPEGKTAVCADYVARHHVIQKANKVIGYAKQNGILVVFVKVGFAEGYHECPGNSPLFAKAKEFNALQLGTWGTEFYQDLQDEKADIVIVKPRISCFYSTSLEAILRANDIDTLLLTGVSTENAILSTARDAHDRDYQVIIVEDACAAGTDEGNRVIVELLSGIATITTSDTVADCLEVPKVA